LVVHGFLKTRQLEYHVRRSETGFYVLNVVFEDVRFGVRHEGQADCQQWQSQVPQNAYFVSRFCVRLSAEAEGHVERRYYGSSGASYLFDKM
jgi:hypothetical protein